MVLEDAGRGGPEPYKARHSQTRRRGTDPGRKAAAGVESNSRLTGGLAAVLLVLLAVEGLTILRVRGLLSLHVFVGMLLIPPVLLKVGSTGWRFMRYYSGSPAYRKKGPPAPPLRLLGPAVVVLTVVLLASGVALVLAPHARGGKLLFVHKASFVLWFGAMTVHVLGHIIETIRVAPLDWARRTRAQVAGASARQWAIVFSLVVGCVLGAVMLGPTHHYLSHTGFLHH
jgi:hypothetical protein